MKHTVASHGSVRRILKAGTKERIEPCLADRRHFEHRHDARYDRTSLPLMINAMQEAGLGPLNWLAWGFRDCAGSAGADFAEFVARRISQDPRTQHQILRCHTAEQMRAVQVAFLEAAADDYNAETGAHVRMRRASQ